MRKKLACYSMKQTVTIAIVLNRTNYGEADRILTVLTPSGKVRILAKGVRKIKSKLAGGAELFSVSELTFLQGRGELHTLISSRLKEHFGNIVQDMDRTMFAYETLKTVNKVTEDEAEHEYFELVQNILKALNNKLVSLDIIRLWFLARLLVLGGYAPNLRTDPSGKQLASAESYTFSFDDMAFLPGRGPFVMRDIKLLRIIFGLRNSDDLHKLKSDSIDASRSVLKLVQTMAKQSTNT